MATLPMFALRDGRRLGAVIVLTLSLASVTGHAAGDGDPGATVDRLHAALASIMRDGRELGFDGRLRAIRPELEATFDFDAIAEAVLGRHWAALESSDRATMRELMVRLTAVSYARNFSQSEGERFVQLGVEEARGGRRVVRTELRSGDALEAGFDYVLARGEGGWRIVNVIANGVSDLSVKRAEYSAVIGKDGFPALVARIGRQITELVEDAASSG